MEIINTRKRFKRRIEFERQILSLVNSLLDDIKPLHGLSSAAIVAWKDSNYFLLKDEISDKLSCLSKDLMVFCDNSKTTFDLDKRINIWEINKRISEFEGFLKQKSSASCL